MVRRETMFEGFRESWCQEYLTLLREAGRDRFQGDWVNDIVPVFNSTKPRTQWNLGWITELFNGNDRIVRTVTVIRPDRRELYTLSICCT